MGFLASPRWRLFLTAWIVYSVFFATNVVREHYPAFSIVEDGTFRVDRYQGFHSDIFVHEDGHSYIGNQVTTSVFAAVPLFLFDPLLDAIEDYSKARLASDGASDTEYRVPDKPNRQQFWQLVTAQGLELRFGAATAVTSVFLMAPLSAVIVVLMFGVLRRRGLPQSWSVWLALVFAFATPMFFRTAPLNPNMFVMYATFGSFLLLWPGQDLPEPLSVGRRFAAGFLAGLTLAIDYSGVVPLLVLYGYVVLRRLETTDWWTAFRESLVFVAGSVPPVLFLWYSQWAMFGNPFLPGQYWMPEVNYTDQGWRGFAWPAPDLFLLNLFDPSYGMYAYGPLLLLGLVPTHRYDPDRLVLPRCERRLAAAFILAFLVFCAANQYSRMQFNTGFRYLVPLVPFIFLQLADHLVRMPRWWRAGIVSLAAVHSLVLASIREPIFASWHIVLEEGLQLPWLRVLRLTSPPGRPVVSSPLTPLVILGLTALVVWGIWWYGARRARAQEGA